MTENIKIFMAMALVLVIASCGNQSSKSDNSNDSNESTIEVNVLNDGARAKSGRVENTHLTRFIEIFLAKNDSSGKLVASCYNSMYGPEGIPESKNTAPQELVEGLDFEKMKEKYGLIGASLNGPKLCTPDWVEIEIGILRDFNGIKAPWVAQLNMGEIKGGVSEAEPYKPVTIARESSIGWNKGTKVLLLDDAEGNTYIMKGFELGMSPQYSYEEFVAAGQEMFKNLPEGWKFRIKILEEDLIETPENGVATILPDEFFNVYDKTGPGMTNYQP